MKNSADAQDICNLGLWKIHFFGLNRCCVSLTQVSSIHFVLQSTAPFIICRNIRKNFWNELAREKKKKEKKSPVSLLGVEERERRQ